MVGCSRWSIVEWTYEGGLKCLQSRCQREPVRYQWDAYDGVQDEWMLSINLGGTAEVYSGFCPMYGTEAFCVIILVKRLRGEQAKLEKGRKHLTS